MTEQLSQIQPPPVYSLVLFGTDSTRLRGQGTQPEAFIAVQWSLARSVLLGEGGESTPDLQITQYYALVLQHVLYVGCKEHSSDSGSSTETDQHTSLVHSFLPSNEQSF